MLKLVVISDTHSMHDQLAPLPEGDILIHAGDLTNIGLKKDYDSIHKYLEDKSVDFKHVIYIAGNHDFGAKHYCHSKRNIHYLHHEAIELEGVKFFGSPYTPVFLDWAYMEFEPELEVLYKEIPEDTQVLITHGPAFSVRDLTQEGCKVGSKSLYTRIKQLPDVQHHIFGHIHEAYGQEVIEGVTFSNCSVVNRAYQVVNLPTVLEVK